MPDTPETKPPKPKFKIKIARVPGTVNLARITLLRRGSFEPTLIADLTYMGNIVPPVWAKHVAYTCHVAATTVANLHHCTVMVSQEDLEKTINGIVRDLTLKVKHALRDDKGNPIIHHLPNGVIPMEEDAKENGAEHPDVEPVPEPKPKGRLLIPPQFRRDPL